MTIKEAKKLYFKYDCSLFAMARDDKDAYENYMSLNISREIENDWRQDLFNILSSEIKKIGDAALFTRMYYLLENMHNKEKLYIMKDLLKYVRYNDLKTKAYVSETVIGRKDIVVRSGMIFWAYDVGEKDVAKELLMFVTILLNSEVADEKLNARIKRDIEKCQRIDSYLKLGVYNVT